MRTVKEDEKFFLEDENKERQTMLKTKLTGPSYLLKKQAQIWALSWSELSLKQALTSTTPIRASS